MRFAASVFLLLASIACDGSVIDPESANLKGTVQSKDFANSRLGVRTEKFNPDAFAGAQFDYWVRVRGKILRLVDGEYQETTLDAIPYGSEVLVWTSSATSDSRPALVDASQVVVRFLVLDRKAGR